LSQNPSNHIAKEGDSGINKMESSTLTEFPLTRRCDSENPKTTNVNESILMKQLMLLLSIVTGLYVLTPEKIK